MILLIQAIIPNEKIFLMQANKHLWSFLYIKRIVPAGKNNRMRMLTDSTLHSHKLTLYAKLLPILHLTDTEIFELFP